MAQTQVYEGTFKEISEIYGKQLAEKRVKVSVEDSFGIDETERPFYETATPTEWIAALREWASTPRNAAPNLSDEAIDRESLYEGRGF